MAQGFSLKDQLFNSDSLGDLAAEFAAGVAGFDESSFHAEAVAGFATRGLLECLEWIADCVESRLAPDFLTMADQLEAAMPPALDPTLQDDDFGRFIHAVPGILAVRHGLQDHRERALDLLYEATKRFSMEFYIRPFLNRWPNETLARLALWSADENYHVRRLVSEGTRPKLPWAKNIEIDPLTPLALLDQLHNDQTRYVTRSVANHLNDIAKIAPNQVVAQLKTWHTQGVQSPKELDWMTRHALRTLVKKGDPEALALLGYSFDAPVTLEQVSLARDTIAIGEALQIDIVLASTSERQVPVLVDYVLTFHRPNGRGGQKVFKLKQGVVPATGSLTLKKRHMLKSNATTFTWHPGPHKLAVQLNGRILGEVEFTVVAAN